MSMNAKMAFMVVIAMLLVTILKAPTTVSANQDFTETERTAAKVSNSDNTIANTSEAWFNEQEAAICGMM